LQVFFINLTRFWTKLRVLVPCFPDFTENSNVWGRIKSWLHASQVVFPEKLIQILGS
jgi:hypothetical protein